MQEPSRRNWRSPAVCTTLANLWQKHMLGLHVVSRQAGKPFNYLYTGFLLRVEPLHYWITAGHVVDEIARLDVRSARWADGYGFGVADSIPVDFPSLPKFSFDREGIDVGIVKLPENTADLLKANPGIAFLDRRGWYGNDNANPFGYYLVGVPDEHHHRVIDGPNHGMMYADIKYPIATLPVERLDPETETDEFFASKEAFYGRLLEVELPGLGKVVSICGMSGGPILSLENASEGHFKYRLFAIQSAWRKESRILRATTIEVLDEIFAPREIRNANAVQ